MDNRLAAPISLVMAQNQNLNSSDWPTWEATYANVVDAQYALFYASNRSPIVLGVFYYRATCALISCVE
jgi:hypothetical protein